MEKNEMYRDIVAMVLKERERKYNKICDFVSASLAVFVVLVILIFVLWCIWTEKVQHLLQSYAIYAIYAAIVIMFGVFIITATTIKKSVAETQVKKRARRLLDEFMNLMNSGSNNYDSLQMQIKSSKVFRRKFRLLKTLLEIKEEM